MTYRSDAPILSQSDIPAAAIQAWLEARGKAAAPEFGKNGQYTPIPADLGQIIVEESHRWFPVIPDAVIVAAQIDEETAGWQSELARERNNPAGIGAEDDDPLGKAKRFPTPRAGVRAQIAHLLTYAAGIGPWNADDPRFDDTPVAWRGTTTTIRALTKRWATSPTYHDKIVTRANLLVMFASNGSWETPMAAQIPGFTWAPADADHYTKGRTTKIRGGAQHYTAGTNSLDWLRSTSGRDDPDARVSVTFLVKHNPTMEDRGWQLVPIEDTSWTTAFANPYTVAIEYEHNGKQPIPDNAYEVLAQTWKDITLYVRAHNLGDIADIQGHKIWVNNPSLVCPDGIDVDRIRRRWQELLAADDALDPLPPSGTVAIPPTQPDPWRSPHGSFWIANAFVAHIKAGDWMTVGYAIAPGMAEDGLFVQYFERARLELHPGGVVMRGLVGSEAYRARYGGAA